MKRIIKSRVFVFILGAILFSSITVFASSYLAKDISFTPKNTNWKKEDGTDITNVKDALDELYVNTIKGEILYEEIVHDTTSLTLKSYEFTEKRNAILIVSASHGNDLSSYYHQLNTPTISNGEMIELYSIGALNTQITGSGGRDDGLMSEYAYLIKANTGTKIEIQAKAYGWGWYKIRLIG